MASAIDNNASALASQKRVDQKKREIEETETELSVKKNNLIRQKKEEIEVQNEKNNQEVINISKEGEKLSKLMREQNSQALVDQDKAKTVYHDILAKRTAEEIKDLDALSLKKINDAKLSSLQKVTTANERYNDPFYRLSTLNATYAENENDFTFKLKLPPYEAKNLFCSVEGKKNIVKLNLSRAFEEKAETGANQKNNTNSFQSISESFTLPSAVDGKFASREYKDGVLTIKFPKF